MSELKDHDSGILDLDFFTAQELVPNPYPYFDELRSKCPVTRESHMGVFAVTGHAEAVTVLKDPDNYSSCISVSGPFPGLPFTPEGSDISEQIAAHRTELPLHEHMVTMDPPDHARARSLLSRLLTPKRIGENKEFMTRLADQFIDEFIATGSCELMGHYGKSFALLTIADLLGVPEEDHEEFRTVLGSPRKGARPGALDKEVMAENPLQWLDDKFTAYLADRRETPRDDVLTLLAQATYRDGSIPELVEVVRTATFLFAAGQETTTKLITAALRVIGERPDLQQKLRDDRSLIPTFIEETLRLESPVKSDFRVAVRDTTLGGTDVPAGSTVMICPGAVNRDPETFTEPNEFDIDRANVREQLAFGRGIHSCPGAPLARAEGLVTIEKFLDRMADIRISEEHHGPEGDRHYDFEPTYILRGLTELHLEFTPIESEKA
ncbi:cytochrome P450 [Gordonia amarae]|uniref:Cytochrome P450 n=2 Tax=Gordonia amarae TaxID=36821 RepID=A0A857M8E6_9ACTN|nr:cytochrome P450 [Gordonia amarae]MCS3877772.1 cytochrome P450 [Gordonia amarae]QHN16467.1 cytochrome P450 [Gordonia amarae]QHN21036.1 cytochrome P450 [Gordonia amarae]QHN29888.1 cytochrome P450 [Gordonia amarae]QHN38663.1 cytochrome P450 [Gordonia amarae]